jgi:hypothetical protein
LIARAMSGATSKTAPSGDASDSVPRGRQLRDAEKDVTRLERRKVSLTQKLLTTTNHTEQTRLGSELADVQRSLQVAEEHWLNLLD